MSDRNLITVSRFAHAVGADRRTVQRRIEANGVESVGASGPYPLYDFDTLRQVMRGDDEGAGSSTTAHGKRGRSEDYTTGFENGRDGAVYSAGEALPEAVDVVLKQVRLKASPAQVSRMALELWLAVAQRIEADTASEGLPSEPLLEHIVQSGEYPEALKPIVASMKGKAK